jgi:hypothetical protein
MGEPDASSATPSSVLVNDAYRPVPIVELSSKSIPTRVCSLLVSRHEQNPPRVPLPSPDPSFYSRSSEVDKQDYFNFVGDLVKRLSILEPPERRHRLTNPWFDGSEDGTVTPGSLPRERLSRREMPQLDPRELMNGLQSQRKRRQIAVDGSDDITDAAFHREQRPPTVKKRDPSQR